MKNILSVRSYFTQEQIENLLYTADSGSTYWADSLLGYETEVKKVLNGESITITDLEDEKEKSYKLTLPKIKKGLIIMAKKEPSHFGYLLSEDYDNTTGDVFLQCCIFGEVIYG